MKKRNYFNYLAMVVMALFVSVQAMAEELPAAYNKAVNITKVDMATPKAARIEMPESYMSLDGRFVVRSFTLATWVKMDKYTNEGANKGNVIMGHTNQNNMNYGGSFILAVDETGKLKFITDREDCIDMDFDTTVELNEWVYLAISYSTLTNDIAVYKNGELVGTKNNGTQFILNEVGTSKAVLFAIGAGFSGACDELQYFDSALTVEEIAQAYTNPEEVEGLKAWYTFEEWAEGNTRFVNKVDETTPKADLCLMYGGDSSVSADGGYVGISSYTNNGDLLTSIGVESIDGRYIPSAIDEVEVAAPKAQLNNGHLVVTGLNGHNVIKVVSLLGQVLGNYETTDTQFEVDLCNAGKVLVVAIESKNGRRTVCKVVDCK